MTDAEHTLELPQGGGSVRFSVRGKTDTPAIIFVNEILTNLHVWDELIAHLEKLNPDCLYVTYDLRGYTALSTGTTDTITLDLLAVDLQALLLHLNITTLHSIIGLGLGASVALTYLHKFAPAWHTIKSFVGMSFPIPGSPSLSHNAMRQKWDERIALAQRVGMDITGDKAVARWFSPDARDGEQWRKVRDMGAFADLNGMSKLANAVVESVSTTAQHADVKEILSELRIPTLFICGSSDGMLPEEMEEYPSLMTRGPATFRLINGAGRMACCERPEDVAKLLVQAWNLH